MDVSGWTIEQRMRLPDWCFGQREIVSVYQGVDGPATFGWAISSTALPNPACIWQLAVQSTPNPGGKGYMRIGLANAVPVNEGDMNAADEIFPGYGAPAIGPDRISIWGGTYASWSFDSRHGLTTGGQKLVLEVYAHLETCRVQVMLIVSELPTSMASWLSHNQ